MTWLCIFSIKIKGMDCYQITFETWNKLAVLYEEKFMDLDLYDETYDAFCDLLAQPNSSVLEIGCDPGNITRYLLNRRPDLSILGIDVAPNMIELAAKNNPAAILKVMDCRYIHELEGKFDGIICGFCVPYLSETDCSKLIEDCKNLLTPKGVLYISFVEGAENASGFQVGSTGDQSYFYFHSLENLAQLLLEHGFEKPQVMKVNYQKSDGSWDVHTIMLTEKMNRMAELRFGLKAHPPDEPSAPQE